MREVERRHGVVTYSDLIACGLSRGQISHLARSGRIVRRHRGVYRMAGAPPSLESQVASALAELHDDGAAWASHHTAARLWGIPVHGRDPRIEVTRPYGLGAARGGIVVHRSTLVPDHHVTRLRRLDITTPSRTLFDLARTTGARALARAVREAVHDDGLACSIASLYRVMYDLGGRGRPGSRRMREVLDAWDVEEPVSESVLDDLGRALLRRVPGIEWQVEMSDAQGYIRRVDGLVRGARLVIELDSRFHDDPQQAALDREDDRRLAAIGFVVLRFRWRDITRLGEETLAQVLEAVRAVAA